MSKGFGTVIDMLRNKNTKSTTPPAESGGKFLNKTLWHYFNPSVNASLEKIQQLVSKSKSEKYVLGILHVQNMASIIFSYGDEISISKTEGLEAVIKNGLGSHSTVVRVSVDDFLYICPYANEEEYMLSFERVSKNIRNYGSNLEGTPIFFAFKAGATIFSSSDPLGVALDHAFIALHECCNTDSKSHCMFSQISGKMIEYKEQMKMAAFFQNIMNNNRIQLAYQPVINSKTGEIKSYEALLRIIKDDGAIITAGPYIAIAEQYGYITQIDHYVLHAVAKELQACPDISIGLNVSSLTIDDKTWLIEARELLKDPDVAKRVIVEITETGVQRQMAKIVEFVEAVQSLGCQVAIDDFGAGYTSFTQLKMLNVDILKIDGVFIKDIHLNPDNQLFVKTLLEFAKAFGLKTVAEFVENGEIAKVLIDLGVDYMQGYYFEKPLNYRPWVKDDREG